jgi:hypothetical protein
MFHFRRKGGPGPLWSPSKSATSSTLLTELLGRLWDTNKNRITFFNIVGYLLNIRIQEGKNISIIDNMCLLLSESFFNLIVKLDLKWVNVLVLFRSWKVMSLGPFRPWVIIFQQWHDTRASTPTEFSEPTEHMTHI